MAHMQAAGKTSRGFCRGCVLVAAGAAVRVLAPASPERPVLRTGERAGRASLDAKLAGHAFTVVDGDRFGSTRCGGDRRGRADFRAGRAGCIAGGGIEARHAKYTSLSIIALAQAPCGRGAATAQS